MCLNPRLSHDRFFLFCVLRCIQEYLTGMAAARGMQGDWKADRPLKEQLGKKEKLRALVGGIIRFRMLNIQME